MIAELKPLNRVTSSLRIRANFSSSMLRFKNEWTVLEINNLQYCTSLTFNRKTYFSQFLWDGLSRTATPATWFFSPDHVVEATQDEDVSGLVEVADVADLSKAVRVEKFWCFFLLAKIFLEKIFQLLLSQNICSSFSEMLRQFFLHLLELTFQAWNFDVLKLIHSTHRVKEV